MTTKESVLVPTVVAPDLLITWPRANCDVSDAVSPHDRWNLGWQMEDGDLGSGGRVGVSKRSERPWLLSGELDGVIRGGENKVTFGDTRWSCG